MSKSSLTRNQLPKLLNFFFQLQHCSWKKKLDKSNLAGIFLHLEDLSNATVEVKLLKGFTVGDKLVVVQDWVILIPV